MNQVTPSAQIISRVKCWLEKLVIGEGLCPFARQPYNAGAVRFVVTNARDEAALLEALLSELLYLRNTPMEESETSLLILPYMLADFLDYNDFLDLVDGLLEQEQMLGEFQVASMHPDYQFADTDFDDAQNYTNRSPYPILHLIREESLERVLAAFPNPEMIPERNIRHMQQLGIEHISSLLAECVGRNKT